VADDKFVVLGLISTKRPELEPSALLQQRVSEASRYLPMDRLGLSSQCGFASSIMGNKISADDQRKKLELVTKTAQEIWAAWE
jgi:5-methyltetrahydropteroyltriglutamate--homocysteine methyltransferase